MKTIKINRVKPYSKREMDIKIESPYTINLSWIKSQAQREQTRKDRKVKNLLRKCLKPFLISVWALFILMTILVPNTEANYSNEQLIAEHGMFINRFPLEKTVIGCYNDRTWEVRQDYICTKWWDHNIKTPPRSQIVIWLKYYSEQQILNRLALVNFESDFNIYASNSSARGYVQTLKSYNVAIDIDSQLKWLKNRETKTYARLSYRGKYGQVRWCGYYWNNYNFKDKVGAWEYAVLTCMYRYHYDANNWTWYWIRGVKATKFYKLYLFWITN